MIGVVAVAVKVAVLAVLLASAEVFIAKLRLFRVPELLAGSFLLALLAVTAANFFTRCEGHAMTDANFAILIDFAAGGLVLAAVLIVWRRDLRAIVRLLAWQGRCAGGDSDRARAARRTIALLVAVGVAVLALRAMVLPWLLARAVAAEPQAQREATPLVNTATSLLITGGADRRRVRGHPADGGPGAQRHDATRSPPRSR